MEHCGQQIMEKVSHLKDISHDVLQQLVYSSYPPLGGISYSGFVSSFVELGDHLLVCDTGNIVVVHENYPFYMYDLQLIFTC